VFYVCSIRVTTLRTTDSIKTSLATSSAPAPVRTELKKGDSHQKLPYDPVKDSTDGTDNRNVSP